jgi:hypothetical protein
MNEDTLRALVREAVSRHLGAPDASRRDGEPTLRFDAGPSHFRYRLTKAGDACLIEPGVRCNDCGYCESHGH